MRIGMIDCERQTSFPNLPLMKLSAWHKKAGDSVEWYEPLFSGHMDIVYVAKVFSFTPDYSFSIDATEIIRSGSGYAIEVKNGQEIYHKDKDILLSDETERIYPDYSLYGITDTAYGFLTKGCPRGCDFCHVADMQGRKSHKVASLSEFWNGQKNIVLLDPNITACSEWKELFQELIDSKAYVDFSQGLDIRLMTEEKIEMLRQIKTKEIHFAWDRYDDKNIIVPKLRMLKEITGWSRQKIIIYVLVGDRERYVTDQDLERIYTLREIGCDPYVMIFNKAELPEHSELKKLQRYVNFRPVWGSVKTFKEYQRIGE